MKLRVAILVAAVLCHWPTTCAADLCTSWGKPAPFGIESRAELTEIGERGCTSLRGDLRIMNTLDVADLEVLSDLTDIVSGGLSIDENAELTNVRGLRNLRGVELILDVWIARNPKLGSLDGLEGIVEIGQIGGVSLYIVNNLALASITGLGGVRGVLPGALMVSSNPALVSVDGLEGVTGIAGYGGSTTMSGVSLELVDNSVLRSVTALDNVQGDLPGALLVADNPLLETMQGLHGIRAAGTESSEPNVGAVFIVRNPSLCVTPDDFRALRTMCETSMGYGYGEGWIGSSTVPCARNISDAAWWDPSRCEGKHQNLLLSPSSKASRKCPVPARCCTRAHSVARDYRSSDESHPLPHNMCALSCSMPYARPAEDCIDGRV